MSPSPTHRGDLTTAPSPIATTEEPSGPPGSAARARRALSSPRAARRAVVLRELLGPPIALRRNSASDVPGLRP